ncbi:MAG: hypothetical protein LH702_04105 [Phormidesmis sp. CAN_BIN44]|nr:hypothetical protein [Phormidesmis sp. CAN_BIN44]
MKLAPLLPTWEKRLGDEGVLAFAQEVYYRLNDRNVLMRLRAWGANVEVLLPWSLRVQMAEDVQDTWKLYQSALE